MILYTLGPRYDTNGAFNGQFLDALAYDGVAAHLFDSKAAGSGDANLVNVLQDEIFLAEPAAEGRLKGWTVSSDAMLVQTTDLLLDGATHRLHRLGGYLVAFTDKGMKVFGKSSGVLTAFGSSPMTPCLPVVEDQTQLGQDGSFWLPAAEFPVQRHRPQ